MYDNFLTWFDKRSLKKISDEAGIQGAIGSRY